MDKTVPHSFFLYWCLVHGNWVCCVAMLMGS